MVFEQTANEPIVLSNLILDCNAQMEQASAAMASMLVDGPMNKRAILQAFGSFELNFRMCCDIAERAVAFVIQADTCATQEERDCLLIKVRGIERRWGQIIYKIECWIQTFGIVQPDLGWVH
jgi:hypothetical protein